jgi:hypothetical protein
MMNLPGCNIKKGWGELAVVISGNFVMMFVYSVVIFFVVNAIVN